MEAGRMASVEYYDSDEVKRAANGRWLGIFIALTRIPPEFLNQNNKEHPCAKCGSGETKFRFTDMNGDGSCHCHCCTEINGGDGFKTLMGMNGWDFPTALRKVAEFLGVPPRKRTQYNGHPVSDDTIILTAKEFANVVPNSTQTEDGNWEADCPCCAGRLRFGDLGKQLVYFCLGNPRCEDSAVEAALGIENDPPAAPVDPLEALAREKRVPVESFKAYGAAIDKANVTFPVYSALGEKVSTFTIAPGSKGLFPKKEDGGQHGLFLPHDEAGKPILPKAGETWHVVEGVKDAAALWSLGLKAIGLPTSNMATKFRLIFKAVHVVLIPDRDKAGDEGATKTARRLYGVAASLSLVALPAEMKEKGGADVRDILTLPDGEKQLREAIAAGINVPMRRRKGGSQSLPSPGGLPSLRVTEGQTDVANGKRMAIRFGQDFRYIDEWKRFAVWDGRRWTADKSLRVDSWARETYCELWNEFYSIIKEIEEDEERTITSFIRATGSARGIRSIVERVRSENGIPASIEQFDRNPWLLNTLNCTIDLSSLPVVKQHSRDDKITALCPVEYDANATCPLWESFINTIFDGDEELIDYIQQAVGYCLTGDVSQHSLFFCYGKGSNGKSTFLNTLMALLGSDYSMKAPADLLLVQQNKPHPTELADLHGKRLVCCIEADDGKRIAESMVKEMTGGDALRARKLYQDSFEFDATHKIWLAANHKPTIRGTDEGIWRRVKLIPFNHSFEGSKDTEMPTKLKAELPGILAWAIRGLIVYRMEGMKEPEKVRLATKKYRQQMDVIGQFIKECCIESDSAKARASSLFEKYNSFVGGESISATKFGKLMSERGYEKIVSNGVFYLGIGIIDQQKHENEKKVSGKEAAYSNN